MVTTLVFTPSKSGHLGLFTLERFRGTPALGTWLCRPSLQLAKDL